MKHLLTVLFVLTVLTWSCNDNGCENAPSFEKCSEKPDTGATCQAYFESWLYDDATGKCSKVGFSGCEPKGFETEAECTECDCYRLE